MYVHHVNSSMLCLFVNEEIKNDMIIYVSITIQIIVLIYISYHPTYVYYIPWYHWSLATHKSWLAGPEETLGARGQEIGGTGPKDCGRGQERMMHGVKQVLCWHGPRENYARCKTSFMLGAKKELCTGQNEFYARDQERIMYGVKKVLWTGPNKFYAWDQGRIMHGANQVLCWHGPNARDHSSFMLVRVKKESYTGPSKVLCTGTSKGFMHWA